MEARCFYSNVKPKKTKVFLFASTPCFYFLKASPIDIALNSSKAAQKSLSKITVGGCGEQFWSSYGSPSSTTVPSNGALAEWQNAGNEERTVLLATSNHKFSTTVKRMEYAG